MTRSPRQVAPAPGARPFTVPRLARVIAVHTLAVAALALAFAEPAHADTWRWPVHGNVITLYRNGGDPYAGGQHRGIDIAAPAGTTVAAASAGTVTFVGVAGDAGLTVSIRTADGRLDTSYLHMGSAAVRRGDPVEAGDPLGTVGTTGRRSADQPHLQLGVRRAGERHAYLDPLSLLPPPTTRPPAPSPRTVPLPLPLPVPGDPLPAPVPASSLPASSLPALAGPPLATAPSPAARPVRPPSLGPALASGPATTPALGASLGSSATRPSPATIPNRSPHRHAASPDARTAADLERPSSASPAAGPNSPHRAGARSPRPGAPSPLARSRGDTQDDTDVDLGWLAACAGLVAAAGLLGRPRGPAESMRRGTRLVTRAADPAARRPAAAVAHPDARKRADSIATWPTTSPRRSTT